MSSKKSPTESDLRKILDAMVEGDETISLNAVSRKAPHHFPYASSLSRRPPMAKLVADAKARQSAVRAHAAKLTKSGPVSIASRLQAAEARVRTLEQQNKLLVAGMRASLLAIGRIGGAAAWQEHFPTYSAAFKELNAMSAIPSATVTQLRSASESEMGLNSTQASTPSPAANDAILSMDRLRSDRSTEPT